MRSSEREARRVWCDDVRFLWLSGPGSFLFAFALSSCLLAGDPPPAFGIAVLVAWLLAYIGGAVAFVFWLALLVANREFRGSLRSWLLGGWFLVVLQPVLAMVLGSGPSLLYWTVWTALGLALATGVTSFWPRGKKPSPRPV